MSIIFDTEIKRRIREERLVEQCSEDKIWGASYDMRLGHECAKDGVIMDLRETHTLSIMPGEFALLTTHELLNLPLNMVGRNGIMSKWAKRGIVSLFSPQIDPGFRGLLIVPVFNAGDQEVLLRYMDDVFTVEFDLGDGQASFGWSQRMGPQHRLSAESVQMLKVKMPLYKDVVLAKGKLEALQASVDNAVSSFSEIKGKVGEFDNRMDSFRKEISSEVNGQSRQLDLLIKVLLAGGALVTAIIVALVTVLIKGLPSGLTEMLHK